MGADVTAGPSRGPSTLLVVRRVVLPAVLTAGALITVVGTFLPWLRSGDSDRNSFQLLSLLDFLGFAPDGPMGWAVRAWPVIVLVCVLAAVTVWQGMWPIASLTGMAGGAYAAGLAWAVRDAATTSLISARYGTSVTIVGGVMLVFASLACAGGGMRDFLDAADQNEEPPWRRS
jgi:hypothetical protein